MSDMLVVTNNNFANTCLVASFCIVLVLVMKISGMSLHAVEFDIFFFPFVKLLGEWGEKHGTMIFHSSKSTEACLPTSTTKARGGSFPSLHGNMEKSIPDF